jgi:hypothetical protein
MTLEGKYSGLLFFTLEARSNVTYSRYILSDYVYYCLGKTSICFCEAVQSAPPRRRRRFGRAGGHGNNRACVHLCSLTADLVSISVDYPVAIYSALIVMLDDS